jgi:hypothetical protein
MQLIQSVLRCLTGPSGAAVHRSTRHQVIRHIGKIGRHPIHRIAAQTPWGFGSVCRYVAVAVGIGTGAGAPVAASALLPPPIPLSVTGGFRPGNSGWPIGGSSAFVGWVVSDTFGPEDTTTQAPFDSPLQFIVNTLPEADDLPLDVVVARVRDHPYPILTSTNIPPGRGIRATGPAESDRSGAARLRAAADRIPGHPLVPAHGGFGPKTVGWRS